MKSDTLKELSALCAQLRDEQRALEEADRVWKEHKARIFSLQTEDIPSLMTELGVTKIVLETGETITVAAEVEASLPKENLEARQAAFDWLESHGHGGLIKTEVSVTFGRDELERAKACAEEIAGRWGQAVLDRNVHANTLKAFIKEQLREGKEIPLELFMARPITVAKIKQS